MPERPDRRSTSKARAERSRGPKRGRDAAVAEQRVQVVLLHRRRKQLLETIAREQRRAAALKQQVEGLSQRWHDTCALNQQLHNDNLHLHQQLELTARAYGITLTNTVSPRLSRSAGATPPYPFNTHAPVPAPGMGALHGSTSSCSISEPRLQLAPPPHLAAAPPPAAAAAAAYSDPYSQPVARQVCGLPLASSSHASHNRCAPAMVLGGDGSYQAAGWPGSAYNAALPPPAAASGSSGAVQASSRLGGSFSSSAGPVAPMPPQGAAWKDAYSRACGRGWNPAGSGHLSPAPFPGYVESTGSNARPSPVAGAPASPFNLTPAAAANPTAAAAAGMLATPQWPAAPQVQGAAAPAPGSNLAPMQIDGAFGFGTLEGGVQRPVRGRSCFRRSTAGPQLQQQQAGPVVHLSQCISQPPPLPGTPPLPGLEGELLLVEEVPSVNATITRVYRTPQEGGGSSSSGKGCSPGPLVGPKSRPAAWVGADSKVEAAPFVGATAACDGWPEQPARMESWASYATTISSTLLGVASPVAGSPALAGDSLGSAPEVPVLPAAAAAAAAVTATTTMAEAVFDVGPAEVDDLLDSLLEEEDPAWLDILGGEGLWA